MNRKLLSTICLASSLFVASCKEKVDTRIEITFSWNFTTDIAAPESIRIEPGEAYGTLPTPNFEREGFTFDGWSLRRDGKGENVTADTLTEVDAFDHTLYAKWLGKQYNVTFDLHGGNIDGFTELAPRKVTCGNKYGAMVIPENPKKKLSTFLGWYLNPEGTGEEVTFSTIVTEPRDHTLHAVYKDTKLHYNFDTEKDLEDFSDLYDALDLKIQNNRLEIMNTSDDPRAYLALRSGLRSGTFVDIDAEFVGEAPAEENVRAGMYVYGLSNEDTAIAGGMLGDPNTPKTREEIKNWYFGQGANNVQAWELAKWNNGHIHLKMNILEDCNGIYFMFDFGRKQIAEGEYEFNPDLWQNNKWVINSIDIDYADHEIVKDKYDFTDSHDIESFIHPSNVDYVIDEEDHSLKISKGNGTESSSLEFETQYIKAGSRVDFEVTYYGDNTYSSANTVGIFTYGNYPNGKKLTGKTNDNGFDTEILDSDPLRVKDFYWGAYGATNEPWAKVKLVNGQKVSFSNYIYEDSYGITMDFKFGTANGYFKINHIEVHREEFLYEFDFAKEKQLEYFHLSENTKMEIDGDTNGDFLKLEKTGDGTHSLLLKNLIKRGQTIKVKVAYQTSDPTYVDGSTQFTFLVHKANLAGEREGDFIALNGNAKWDGGWDGQECELTATLDDDCYGLWMQLVFNNIEGSFFKISSIVIE